MDVLAASLTAGLDASPGEDPADGDLEAEAPMLLQELRHFFAASCSLASQCLDPDCLAVADVIFSGRRPCCRQALRVHLPRHSLIACRTS